MIEKRPYAKLGTFKNEWLNAHYHFSFGDYYDPARMGWGKIRVLNDDIIAPHQGFPPHPHRDMEIVTFVRKGAITHTDNLGNHGETGTGDVQVMSAGSGIVHSEMNAGNEPLNLFQIWIQTNHKGHRPSWGSKSFPKKDETGKFVVLASGFQEDLEKGALEIHADTRILGATVSEDSNVGYEFSDTDRLGYLVVSSGSVRIGDETLTKGDAVAISDMQAITVQALGESQIVLIDTAQ